MFASPGKVKLKFFVMSQIDDFLRPRTKSGIPNSDIPQVPLVGGDVISDVEIPLDPEQSEDLEDPSADRRNFLSRLDNLIAGYPLTGITSRDQIINPEKILEGYAWSNSAEDIALYNRYLGILRNIQSQQEAAYQEWYNSTYQQALRDQQAGLNPDILGISGLSNASNAAVGSAAPFEGLPTSDELNVQKEQLRLSRFQSVMTAISSICSIPSSFAGAFGSVAGGLGSLKSAVASAQLSRLQGIEQFEKLAGSEISSRLSDAISSSLSAGKSLDLSEWFANEDNFAGIPEAYTPSGSDFSASFANVRKRMQRSLGSAYADGKVTAENQGSFSALLADPRYSSDQLVQIAHLKPYMQARTDLQLLEDKYKAKVAEVKTKYADGMDIASAVDAANSKFEYDGAYYESLDGAKMALQEWYVKEANGIVSRMKSSIEHNLLDMYNANPNNERGFAAAYLSGSRTMDWYEYLIAQELSAGLNRVSAPVPSQSQPNLVDPSSASSSGTDLWQNSFIRAGELLP